MGARLFITGATGNTGRAFLARFFGSHMGSEADVVCLRRPGERRGDLSAWPVRVVEGDASDATSLRAAYDGPRAIVHISSILHAPAVVAGCRPATRIVAISSTGRFSRLRREARAIAAGERAIEESGLPWTILRPTMIYGSPFDRNISKLIALVARSRVIPLPGGGAARFQPVTAEDLAAAILAALGRPKSIGKSYTISGASAHSLREMVELAAALMGRRVLLVPIPVRAAAVAARLAGLSRAGPRVRADQIMRLLEDKTCDHAAAAEDLGFSPLAFEAGLRRELELMGRLKG